MKQETVSLDQLNSEEKEFYDILPDDLKPLFLKLSKAERIQCMTINNPPHKDYRRMFIEGCIKDKQIQDSDSLIERNWKRYAFYRDGYRQNLSVLLGLTGCLTLSIFCNVFQWVQKQDAKPEYFAADSEGRIVPLYPLGQPIVNATQVKNWLVKAIGDIYTVSAADYQKVIADKYPLYFIPSTNKIFAEAFLSSNRLNAIVEKSLSTNINPNGPIEIVREGVVQNRYQWVIKMPVQINYMTNQQYSREIRVLTITVIRVDTRSFPSGLAIKSLVEMDPVSSQAVK